MPSPGSKKRWLKNHLGADRSLLRVVLPSSLLLHAQREAARHGLSLTAYLCTALSFAPDFDDQIPDRARLLAHVHGIKFRSARVPSPETQVSTTDTEEGTP